MKSRTMKQVIKWTLIVLGMATWGQPTPRSGYLRNMANIGPSDASIFHTPRWGQAVAIRTDLPPGLKHGRSPAVDSGLRRKVPHSNSKCYIQWLNSREYFHPPRADTPVPSTTSMKHECTIVHLIERRRKVIEYLWSQCCCMPADTPR